MSLESKIDKLNTNLEALIKTLQQDVNSVAPPAQPANSVAPPAQPAAPPTMPPPAAPSIPLPAAPPTMQPPTPPTMQPPTPPVQTAAAPAAPPAPADNVVQHPAASGPQLTLEQLNGELMAAVAKLGGGQAAAQQVMNLISSKYGVASLQGLAPEQYQPLLNDINAMVGG